MNITIITGPFMCLPPDSIGAVEKLWNTVGYKWISQGVEVHFVCKNPNHGPASPEKVCVKGYERTGNWLKDFLLDFVYSYRALYKVKSTDILVLNSLWSPILIRFFRKRYKKAVYSVERFPKKQMGKYKKIGHVDAFRCCSTAVYNALLKQNPELKPYTWIVPNFIDTAIFCGGINHLSNNPSVVYAGRIHREKGLDILVTAINVINRTNKIKVSLTMIGAYDKERGGSGEVYKCELNGLGEYIDIEWIEPIYDAKKLAEKIKEHDVFCYPSIAERGEALSTAPLEAMGLGLPVILSNLDCFQDYLQQGVNGLLFDHRSENAPDLLAERITAVLNDPILYEKLSNGALETAKKFSADLMAEQYLRKFEELLHG